MQNDILANLASRVCRRAFPGFPGFVAANDAWALAAPLTIGEADPMRLGQPDAP